MSLEVAARWDAFVMTPSNRRLLGIQVPAVRIPFVTPALQPQQNRVRLIERRGARLHSISDGNQSLTSISLKALWE